MSRISIVVPVYHNEGSLHDLWAEFQKLAQACHQDTFEFVFVDDGSGDGSYQVLTELATADERVRVVKLTRNFGSNAAIMAGLAHARGDATVVIAADLQDPPQLIPTMLAEWRAGRKVVLATRAQRRESWVTTLPATCFYRLFRTIALSNMPLGGFDFFLLDRQAREILVQMPESHPYLMGQILWMGFTPSVLPYTRVERPSRYGRSMWTWVRKCKYFVDAFVGFSALPVRLATSAGILLTLIGTLFATLGLIRGLDSWQVVLLALVLVSGVQLLALGILGEYVVRHFDETRRRPRFIVEQVIESDDESWQNTHRGSRTV